MPLRPKAKPATGSKRRTNSGSSLTSSQNTSAIPQLRRQYRPVSENGSGRSTSPLVSQHLAFFPLLILVFIIWCIYRYLFRFPVWFDETIGKAVFFGLPVGLYLSLTRSRSMAETMDPKYLQPGLWMGLAIGGIFGFAGTLASLLRKGVVIQAAPLFAAQGFWVEFMLAMMTGFWESMFFYCWIMVVIMEKYRKWPLLNQALLTAAIFLAFHIPNTLLRFSLPMVSGQLVLLFFFGLGQALLFSRVRNVYALAMSHAIWGMVLLVHTR
jgi:hypothetical protein